MNIISKTAAVACVAMSPVLGSMAMAEAHAPYKLLVPKGLCSDTIQQMVVWSKGRTPNTAYALPTAAPGSTATGCGEGEPAVAGIATADSKWKARRAALKVCNENRGSNGRCVIIGTLVENR